MRHNEILFLFSKAKRGDPGHFIIALAFTERYRYQESRLNCSEFSIIRQVIDSRAENPASGWAFDSSMFLSKHFDNSISR